MSDYCPALRAQQNQSKLRHQLCSQLLLKPKSEETNLSGRLQTAGKLELVHSVVHWFAIGGTLGNGAFTASSAHTNTVDDIACRKQNKT